ncbi:MAG: hypothetical protein ACRD8U_21280 [Pyrinomonadaceae bacterium]
MIPRIDKPHPARQPSRCSFTGVQADPGGFWQGQEIDVQPGQLFVLPLMADRYHDKIAHQKGWSPPEVAAGLKVRIDQLEAELEEERAMRTQLERRLTRVYPRRGKKARADAV